MQHSWHIFAQITFLRICKNRCLQIYCKAAIFMLVKMGIFSEIALLSLLSLIHTFFNTSKASHANMLRKNYVVQSKQSEWLNTTKLVGFSATWIPYTILGTAQEICETLENMGSLSFFLAQKMGQYVLTQHNIA